ncbi:hypothetical protein N0824_03429 [Microcystis sp. 0824]|nr:hypothetical protein N0824_03429 [Microcystis sp. 0824]
MKEGNKTLHPTPHTLPPRKTFCRKPYLNLGILTESCNLV